jgi:hypothetical protein
MSLTLSQDDARERCTYWQRLLRLQDWDVDVRVVRRATLGSPGSCGSCEGGTYRRAIIRIADPVDFTPDEPARLRDMEDTLLHELLHLHLHDLRVPRAKEGERETAEQIAEERAIEAVVGALLTLERRGASP